MVENKVNILPRVEKDILLVNKGDEVNFGIILIKEFRKRRELCGGIGEDINLLKERNGYRIKLLLPVRKILLSQSYQVLDT